MFWIFGLMSVAYGICVGWKNSGTYFYVFWFFLGAFFMGIQSFFVFSLYRYLPIWFWKIAVVLLLIGMSLLIFLLGCIASKYYSKGISNAKYIIVLGAQWKETGPSKALKYRLDRAKEYLEKNEKTLCIVSGGQGFNEPCSEAEGMAKYLVEHGISMERIIQEDKSTNTLENIRFSMKYLEDISASICVVSNGFHVFRACGIAKKQGLTNAYGLSAKSDWLYLPNNALREVFGIIKDFFVGNM
ncbi:MAG: YdcF family protein [Bacillota bacterium]|nr:YdcF family protein [Bacillota bacterium]